MGLDMYLKGKRYLSEYDEVTKPLKTKVNEALQGPGFLPVNQVEAEAMYWRKANAIHDWFVQNCQGGVDECQETAVDREQLQALLKVCKVVVETKNPTLLPTAPGFFFGNTEYDEYYYDTLAHTAARLELLLTEEYADWDFYYQASW
jgi:hypothetical protein